MNYDFIRDLTIEKLLSSDAGKNIRQIIDYISSLQNSFYALLYSEDTPQLKILKIGTVVQIFLIDILATGKNPSDLTEDDWKDIASKVGRYAILESEQGYSEFVFTLYADYIDISVELLEGRASEKNLEAIKSLSETIRKNKDRLEDNEINEIAYTEACLWLSLEAMMKLLCSYFTGGISEEYGHLINSISQLAFEYGRYVLYSKEQKILERYLQNQRALDVQLKSDYEIYVKELRVQAESFQQLIDDAFSPGINEALANSVALARAAGVSEDELLTSVEDVDAFFLE